MPSARHEFLHQFCANSPELLNRLLHLVGFKEDLDETVKLEELSGDATDLMPAPRHADTTVHVATPHDGEPFVLVIEAQLGQDKHKRFTWPVYVANLRDRHRKEVVLVVICPDEIADWAAEPIETGRQGWWTTQTTRPLVISPSRIPLPTLPEALEQDLDYTVFAALLHGRKAFGPGILHLTDVLEAVGHVPDPKHQATLAEMIGATLAEGQDRTLWRHFMSRLTFTLEDLRGTALGDWLEDELLARDEQVREQLEEQAREHAMAQAMAQVREQLKEQAMAQAREQVREQVREQLKEQAMAQAREQVRAQEKAEDVLMVLRTRGVPLDETEQARIADCHDLDLLRLWLTRALTADTAAQVFTGPTVVRPRGTTTPV